MPAQRTYAETSALTVVPHHNLLYSLPEGGQAVLVQREQSWGCHSRAQPSDYPLQRIGAALLSVDQSLDILYQMQNELECMKLNILIIWGLQIDHNLTFG